MRINGITELTQEKDLIFGIHPIEEALESGKEFSKLLIQNGLRSDTVRTITEAARKREIPVSFVPIFKLNKLTRKNHQGMVGFVSPISFGSIEQLVPSLFEKGETPLLVILDQISDVRNFGAIVRTALSMNAHAVIIPFKGAANISGDAVKASAGTLFKLPICRENNLEATVKFLQNSGIQVVACSEKASKSIATIDLTLPTALIFGNEETGIANELMQKADYLSKIPISNEMDSLNVSVAAGMALYETISQRGDQ